MDSGLLRPVQILEDRAEVRVGVRVLRIGRDGLPEVPRGQLELAAREPQIAELVVSLRHARAAAIQLGKQLRRLVGLAGDGRLHGQFGQQRRVLGLQLASPLESSLGGGAPAGSHAGSAQPHPGVHMFRGCLHEAVEEQHRRRGLAAVQREQALHRGFGLRCWIRRLDGLFASRFPQAIKSRA